MSDPNQFRLRISFVKQGRLALLSHLEVARALERAVRRSGLPFAVSNGFSPHMKLAFGAALPVGVGGTRELADLQLTRYVAPEEALAALKRASVPDLMVTACAYVEPKAPAASAAFPVSTYQVVLSTAPASLPVPAQVHVVRKKKEKVLDVAEFLVGEPVLAGCELTLSLEQKPTGSLRPDKLLAACLALMGPEGQPDGAAEGPAGVWCALGGPDAPSVEESAEVPVEGAAAAPAEDAPVAPVEILLVVPNVEPASFGDAAGNPLRVLSMTRIDQRSA